MDMQVYAVVKEKRSSRPSDTICASREHRESLVYSSLSNRIEVRVVTNPPSRRRHKADYFAIRYECSYFYLLTCTFLSLLFSSRTVGFCVLFFFVVNLSVYSKQVCDTYTSTFLCITKNRPNE